MIGRVLSTYEYMHMDNGRVVSAYDWARGERARGHGWHRIPGCEFGWTSESVQVSVIGSVYCEILPHEEISFPLHHEVSVWMRG